MDERVIQFRVGVMVLATLFITGILLLLFGEWKNILGTKNTYYIKFPEAPGVTRETPIQMSGILIGRVKKVDLTPEGEAIVTADIDRRRQIRADYVCRIKSTLLGDATLLFVRATDPDLPDTPLEPGSVIKGVVAPDPIQVVADVQQGLKSTTQSVTRSSEDFDKLIRRLDGLVVANEKQINEIVPRINETMTLLRDMVKDTNQLVGDPQMRQKLREGVDQVPELMRQSRDTLTRMNRSLNLLDENLQNMKQFTAPLGQQGMGVFSRLDGSLQKLDLVLDDVHRFSTALNSQQGSLGQLLNNPDLYNNLSQAAANVDQLSQQLRPILNDARVFTDKIARHPEMLGVRGALERRPGIK
jgi:phospholipid/cholesterol/gamma-HCH transport system substrate-binding protein